MSVAKDPQRERVYRWQDEILPPEEMQASIHPRRPFEPWFLEFHAEAWRYGFERYGHGGLRSLITVTPPELRYSFRLRRFAGRAGLTFGRSGQLRARITFGQRGPTRRTLLHEQAHLLNHGPHLLSDREAHGPRFVAIALDLYERFLGVNRTVAIFAAITHQVGIDLALLEEGAP